MAGAGQPAGTTAASGHLSRTRATTGAGVATRYRASADDSGPWPCGGCPGGLAAVVLTVFQPARDHATGIVSGVTTRQPGPRANLGSGTAADTALGQSGCGFR